MPFNGTTKRIERIWNFVTQKAAGENATRSDFDVSHNDIKDSANAAIAYLEGLVAAITGLDPRFMGYLAANPATRTGGGALVAGDFYVNSIAKDIRFWNGSSFIRGVDLPIASTYFKSLFPAIDQAELRGLIGLGSSATQNSTAFATAAQGAKADAAVLAAGGLANNISDWRSIHTSGTGFYEGGAGAANSPSANACFGHYVKQSASRGAAIVVDSAGAVFMVVYNAGVWGSWFQIPLTKAASLSLSYDLLTILNQTGTETLARFIADGAVELYHNGSKKAETDAAGLTVTGVLRETARDNEEWQTAPGRSFGVFYQNTTGRAIDVAVRGKWASGAGIYQMFLSVAKTAVRNDICSGHVGNINAQITVSQRVPPGHYYAVFADAGMVIERWAEIF